jgi:predicted metal-dependent hydrolase
MIKALQKEHGMEYSLVRSKRKTIGMELRPDGTLLVRAPMRMSKAAIDDFILRHRDWIEAHRKRAEQRKEAAEAQGPLTQEELKALAKHARTYIPARVRFYAPRVGVTFGRIAIRSQRTRWGSCSSQGNLNFNCLLMLTPPQVIDSVVVHELCHRKRMDHSKAFYDEVLRVFPDYWEQHKWLNENGEIIMAMLDR